MSLYVDTSALLKRYVDEPDSARAEQYLLADTVWITARHTFVEMRRNLARLLEGKALAGARSAFSTDWRRTNIVEIDETTAEIAAQIGETTGCRTLDALHLAAAMRVGGPGAVTVLTFDVRQAQAARTIGLAVIGA